MVLELSSPSSLIMNTAAVQLVNYEFGATHFCGYILGLKQAFVGTKFSYLQVLFISTKAFLLVYCIII